MLGSRFGVEAIDAAHEGDFGKMVALRGTEIVRVPLTEALAEPKLLDPQAVRDGRGVLRLSPAGRDVAVRLPDAGARAARG